MKFKTFKKFICSACIVFFVNFNSLAYTHTELDDKNHQDSPDVFIQKVTSQALAVLKKEETLLGEKYPNRLLLNSVVDKYIFPHVNFQKTTRLVAGPYWNHAKDEEKEELTKAFRNTLIKTYSTALVNVSKKTIIQVLPFKGNIESNDIVIKSLIKKENNQSMQIHYRLEKTLKGWNIYDVNVEGVWLIENYRNQFIREINNNGIRGLIKALNIRNQSK